MFKKIFWVSIVVIGIIITYLITTAAMPTILSLINVAESDPSAGNYTEYQYALGALPIWFYIIPALVGGILIIMILRKKEGQRY